MYQHLHGAWRALHNLLILSLSFCLLILIHNIQFLGRCRLSSVFRGPTMTSQTTSTLRVSSPPLISVKLRLVFWLLGDGGASCSYWPWIGVIGRRGWWKKVVPRSFVRLGSFFAMPATTTTDALVANWQLILVVFGTLTSHGQEGKKKTGKERGSENSENERCVHNALLRLPERPSTHSLWSSSWSWSCEWPSGAAGQAWIGPNGRGPAIALGMAWLKVFGICDLGFVHWLEILTTVGMKKDEQENALGATTTTTSSTTTSTSMTTFRRQHVANGM